MSRFLSTIILASIVVGGAWALYHRDHIKSPQDVWDLATSQIGKSQKPPIPTQLSSWSMPQARADSVRIASFNVQALSKQKLEQPQTARSLIEILKQFDVIAIQEIRPEDQPVLQQFVNQLNEIGRSYAYSISPALGSVDRSQQSAFVFDQASIQLDDAFAYTVQDPEHVLTRQPYVGWFRAAKPRPDRAFTFTLVNVHLDAAKSSQELPYLSNLFRAVRNDGRVEDDVIILGDFYSDPQGFVVAEERSGLTWAIKGEATNTQGNRQFDNLIFDPKASTEFTGQSGVFDFLKQFNLTMDEALMISDHLPVWAEFSIFEGFAPGRVAQDEISNGIR